ncbi:hypothetical protein yc1106_09501 [Curvularia clavata]|uniref:TauD/TfdA-like domain-containing protein n=1 Tax=Curvularia clavata TaxID=95742 RepID=A0A9Q8ZF64_CURCL|nr:hypothetical protein yc1106_09501 [Curvularia clavata]
MSQGKLLSKPCFTIAPLEKLTEQKFDGGAVISGLDLNDISDEDVKSLSDAIWTHKVVIVKGQKNLAPIKQWELVTRFDPEAPQVHSHGDTKTFSAKGGVLSAGRDVFGIPGVENVRLIGKGFQGEDHYGLKNVDIKRGLGHDFHAEDLDPEEFNAGHTRFHRWHIDAPLYAREPAWFTTLRCIKRPRLPKISIHWDDGTGQTLETEPGLTAFFNNVQTYDLMTEEEKKMADHSWVEYAPYPYQWIENCKGNSNGLGLASQGKEKTLGELGEWDSKDVKTYPMVWLNPVTGEKAFMVHGICAYKLFIRSSPDEQPVVIDDVVEIRAFLKKIQERVLKPEYILLPKVDEGDIVIGEQDSCSTAEQQEVDALRSRIFELESELRGRRSSAELHQTDTRPPLPNHDDAGANNAYAPGRTLVPERNDGEEQSSNAADSATKDAVSILEFLAWGRRKNPYYNCVVSPEASADVRPSSRHVGDTQPGFSFPAINGGDSQLSILQLLLPNKRQLLELVRYHEECLLWCHCSFHAPTFRSQVEVFYSRFNGVIESPGLNLQWLALLFAVLTGSITCAPDNKSLAWGFRLRERETLSKKWFRAVFTCLNAAEYAANQSMLSVQAISTLTISAHLLGFSNMHSIHVAAVIRIAQGLGLHRITDESPGSVVDKECGRRLWSQLCCQDWFGIPFSDTYLINHYYSTSDQPLNCHDKDMVKVSETEPTMTTYCRLLTRIASIMPQLQDDLISCNTLFTKYEQVIKWDKQMRILASERPSFLLNIPIDPSWPCYISWARRSLAISSAHKIIMIHRSFLSDSFTNPAFCFTRRTCLAASKTIIKEWKLSMDDDGPSLWIHQAFSVAAAIILILDVMHRCPTEIEYGEHKQLAEDTVKLLQQRQNSMIATRGSELLLALLLEISDSRHTLNTRKRRHDGTQTHADPCADAGRKARQFNVSAFVKSFCNSMRQNNTTGFSNQPQGYISYLPMPGNADQVLVASEAGTLPANSPDLQLGQNTGNDTFFPPALEGGTVFENLLYLANHDFTCN